MGALEALVWGQYPLLVLGFLVVLNLVLIHYTAKNYRVLLPQGGPRASNRTRRSYVHKIRHAKNTDFFAIKKWVEHGDDRIAMQAYRAFVKKSAVNLQMLQRIIFRSNYEKTLYASCIYRTAKANPAILFEAVSPELSDWSYIVIMKSFAKAGVPNLVPFLVNAQEHSSPAVQDCARDLLARSEGLERTKAG